MSTPTKIRFMVVALEDIDSDRKHVYRVRLKSEKGHKLVLESNERTLFEGLPKGAVLETSLMNPQTTLPSSTMPVEESPED